MEASFTSVPSIIIPNKNTSSTILSLFTIITGMAFLVFQIYSYRKNRKLRTNTEFADLQ